MRVFTGNKFLCLYKPALSQREGWKFGFSTPGG
jgi:hypothetical protein